MDVESFKVEQLGFIDYLLRCPYGNLLALGDEHYAQLIWNFYTNVRLAKVGFVITLECQVKYTRFTLTESDLNEILDLATVQQCDFSTIDLKHRCLAEFTILPPSLSLLLGPTP